MRFPFIELPGELRPLIRPAVPVQIEDLDDALAQDEIVVGGARTTGRLLQVELTLGDVRFQAPAWFCDPWNLSFGLLGQEGFFRFFRVTLCAAEGWLECEPEEEGIALVSAVGPLSPGPSGL